MDWKSELKQNITTLDELARLIPLSESDLARMREVVRHFPFSISRYYFSLMNLSDPDDPIRKMALPDAETLDFEGSLDTSGEAENTVMPAMQHKYAETAMILTTNQCAMYCRHCFRRRLVGLSSGEAAGHIAAMAAYVRAHPEIDNVLLSGGDALLNENAVLEEYLRTFSAMPQLDLIRIGTRTPVTFPVRLKDEALLDMLEAYSAKKQIYIITHFNSPNELTDESAAAVYALQKRGLTVKNQTVLMRGVNDSPVTLARLLRGLARQGVVPHYLFQCRPVAGVKNRFQIPLCEGSRIVNAALAKVDGLAKSAGYVMSHVTGKIRILGQTEPGEMLFQYVQAKDPARINRLFARRLDPDAAWLAGDPLAE